jgi:CCR4-NOT transcription complex subunit 7/8
MMNENLTWISFQGAFDFAYLVKPLLGRPLQEENQFIEEFKILFPSSFDLKALKKDITLTNGASENDLRGGLERLGDTLGVRRAGTQH